MPASTIPVAPAPAKTPAPRAAGDTRYSSGRTAPARHGTSSFGELVTELSRDSRRDAAASTQSARNAPAGRATGDHAKPRPLAARGRPTSAAAGIAHGPGAVTDPARPRRPEGASEGDENRKAAAHDPAATGEAGARSARADSASAVPAGVAQEVTGGSGTGEPDTGSADAVAIVDGETRPAAVQPSSAAAAPTPVALATQSVSAGEAASSDQASAHVPGPDAILASSADGAPPVASSGDASPGTGIPLANGDVVAGAALDATPASPRDATGQPAVQTAAGDPQHIDVAAAAAPIVPLPEATGEAAASPDAQGVHANAVLVTDAPAPLSPTDQSPGQSLRRTGWRLTEGFSASIHVTRAAGASREIEPDTATVAPQAVRGGAGAAGDAAHQPVPRPPSLPLSRPALRRSKPTREGPPRQRRRRWLR